jgi:DinB superfamily
VNTDFSAITSMFPANSSLFEKATRGIPDGQWLTQPDTDSNHLLCTAGHVVVHRAFVPKYLGVEWAAPWTSLFARGAKLVAAEQYPSVAEIQRAWKEVSEKLTAALPNASAEVLAQQVLKEKTFP